MSRLCPRCGAFHWSAVAEARYCSCTPLTATEAAREAARAKMHRRQEILTRGEILDAIDATRRTMGGNVGDAYDVATRLLDTLREAFE